MAELEEKVREGSRVSWMLELRESEVRKLEEHKTLPGSLKGCRARESGRSGSECWSATAGGGSGGAECERRPYVEARGSF
jgi:hypothetical protein